jgi:hypothetical protein
LLLCLALTMWVQKCQSITSTVWQKDICKKDALAFLLFVKCTGHT